MAKAHEQKVKLIRTKVWPKADPAMDMDTFIQATTKASCGVHAYSKLITHVIIELTLKLQKLTWIIYDYQAKASKFKDLPTWIPRDFRKKRFISRLAEPVALLTYTLTYSVYMTCALSANRLPSLSFAKNYDIILLIVIRF
jgi:hypothetical protein